MRVCSKAAVLIVICLVLGFAVASTDAADSEVGKKIFAQKCASCHGPDGKGSAKMADMLKVKIPDLAASATKSDAELLKLLADGKKPMPAFGKSLSNDELHAVLEYARKLAKGGK